MVYISHSILTECRVEGDGTCPVLLVNGGSQKETAVLLIEPDQLMV